MNAVLGDDTSKQFYYEQLSSGGDIVYTVWCSHRNSNILFINEKFSYQQIKSTIQLNSDSIGQMCSSLISWVEQTETFLNSNTNVDFEPNLMFHSMFYGTASFMFKFEENFRKKIIIMTDVTWKLWAVEWDVLCSKYILRRVYNTLEKHGTRGTNFSLKRIITVWFFATISASYIHNFAEPKKCKQFVYYN